MAASSARRRCAQTCEQQMRPVLMTCVAACVGLLPAAFSTAIGSQVQRPLAIVVVGGMLLAPILFLTVLPAMIGTFSRTPRPGYICGVTPSDELLDLGDRRLRLRRLAPRQGRRAGAHDAGVPARGTGLHRDVARLPAEALRRHALQRHRLRPHRLWRLEPVARRSRRALHGDRGRRGAAAPAAQRSASRIACWSATATAARSRSTTRHPIPSRCAPW